MNIREDNKELKKLLKEGEDICEEMEVLCKTAIWLKECVDKENDKIDENTDWEEKENTYKRIEELGGRVEFSVRELLRLDKKYRKICQRVNKAYGREVMKISEELKDEDI